MFKIENLTPGEEISIEMHPHWWFFFAPAMTAAVTVFFSLVIWMKGPTGNFGTVLGYIVAVAFILSALWLLGRYLRWVTTMFVITSHRIIYRHGVLAKSGIEIPLERVNNVNFNQSMFERLVGAGDLLIESGGEDGQSTYYNISHPDKIQSLIHAQLEGHARRRASYGQSVIVPSEGSSVTVAPGDNVTAESAPDAAGWIPPTSPAGSATLSTVEQFERLEAMLSRGMITQEEFTSAKARLLA